MKKSVLGVVSAILTAFVLSGCGDSECKNAQNLFDGCVVVKYHADGRVQSISRFENNKLNGLSKSYYANGRLREEREFKNDVPHGIERKYHANGQLLHKIAFKDGKMDGAYESYFENGQVQMQSRYKNGRLVGEYKRYFENGKVRESGTFSEVAAFYVGEFREFFNNETPKAELNYGKNGELLVGSKRYFKDGSLKNELLANSDKMVFRAYSQGGQLDYETQVINAEPNEIAEHGLLKNYDKKGAVKEVVLFERGKRKARLCFGAARCAEFNENNVSF